MWYFYASPLRCCQAELKSNESRVLLMPNLKDPYHSSVAIYARISHTMYCKLHDVNENIHHFDYDFHRL